MNRLHELRLKKGFSQNRLELESGINQALLSRYERHICEIGEANIVKICRALEVSADELLGMVVRDKEKPME
jgi:transcriptional regulator with XRE-family HTH domain